MTVPILGPEPEGGRGSAQGAGPPGNPTRLGLVAAPDRALRGGDSRLGEGGRRGRPRLL